MTNKKCLLDTIASYSLDVTLAVGNDGVRGHRAYPEPVRAAGSS
jgi:hypothetical protein